MLIRNTKQKHTMYLFEISHHLFQQEFLNCDFLSRQFFIIQKLPIRIFFSTNLGRVGESWGSKGPVF
jgi:hypothetical protein